MNEQNNSILVMLILGFVSLVGSISGTVNLVFLRQVLADIKSLKDSRHTHAQRIQENTTDIGWLKQELDNGDGSGHHRHPRNRKPT